MWIIRLGFSLDEAASANFASLVVIFVFGLTWYRPWSHHQNKIAAKQGCDGINNLVRDLNS
jgi:hypothetical protein